MALEDFERELAASTSKSEPSRKRSRSRSRERRHRRSRDDRGKDEHRSSHKHHHHRSSQRDRDDRDDEHSHKRSRKSRDHDRGDKTNRRSGGDTAKREIEAASPESVSEDEWIEKGANAPPPDDETLDELLEEATNKNLKRDDWMEAPSALDVDYVQRRVVKKKQQASTTGSLGAELSLKMHKNELNHVLRELQELGQAPNQDLADEDAIHEVDYEFGDGGANWRMTRLQGVYRKAKDTGRPVEEIAMERYTSLRDFDDAREEETELDRRKTYGRGYVGKIKPSGELFEERKLAEGIHRKETSIATSQRDSNLPHHQGEVMPQAPAPLQTIALDQTALNRLKAKVMRAKLKGGPEAAQLEAEYNTALAGAANSRQQDIIVLDATENRMLAGGRSGEVTSIDNKRGRERGLVEENEDMSIEDMVRQERRTKNRGEGQQFAERIAKDAKFTDDLDYMDENAAKLSKHVAKSDVNLRNLAIGDYQKMQKILANCKLCHHEDKGEAPIAPIVSLGTRVYLTLATEPEVSKGGAVLVPIQHRTNLLECDDDEWEEIRNFMKCLTRMYHSQNRAVVFYENAAQPHRKMHAAMVAVPLPIAFGETAPAFFREAIMAADEEWSQHKKLIDTLGKARNGLGRAAFRKSLVKEMPYFHVWFELDGGLGHVIEDEGRWPRGDLFAREIVAGMVDVGPEVVKKQGRWVRGDSRVEGFRKRWRKFDWTRVLLEAEA